MNEPTNSAPPEPTRALKYGAPCYLCAAGMNWGDVQGRKPCIGGNVGCINWPSIYADGQP